MLKIIHSPDIKRLLKVDAKRYAASSYIILDNELKSDKYRDMLMLKGMREIRVEEADDEARKIYEKEYINSIAEMSSVYNSIEWWANPISEKNEHVSRHYRNLYLFYSMARTLKKYADAGLNIFVVCNNEIFEQLKCYCRQNNIKIKSLENPITYKIKKNIKNTYVALSIIYFFIEILFRKIYLSYALGNRIRSEINKTEKIYIIRTWFINHFLSGGEDYQDDYFGRLPEYAVKHGYYVYILAGILSKYIKVVSGIKKAKNLLIIPEEYFVRYSDILRLPVYLLLKGTRFKSRILFNGLDASLLYEREMANGRFSAAYARNILRYFIAKRFAVTVKFIAYIQTYENYAWEKMTILGIKEVCPEAKIIGFQHAFISRNSFKYFPGKVEKDVIPLPDKIITIGKATKEIMERYGNYRPNILKIGCALRQEYISSLKPFKRRRFNKVVIPLTMVQRESILIMNFLHESGLSQTNVKVIIRCHPAAPFNSFKKYIDFKMPYNFIINNEKRVYEELLTTDMVLYTWTTVAVEALKLGIPVIYLDILRPMYVDPLFECNVLKKDVRSPEELLPIIENIYKIDDEVFYKEQQMAQNYLAEYFYPVTQENLSSFIPYK